MKIIVCIKQVLATGRIKFESKSHTLVRKTENSYINPNDLYAIQMAVQLKEKYGGKITAITMGPSVSEEVLHEAIAMGVDQGLLLTDPRFAGADTLATSYVLAKGILSIGEFDVILCGAESTDSGTGQVGPQLAEQMDLPQVVGVKKVEKKGNSLRLMRTSDGFLEVIEAPLPVLITISREAGFPQLPSLLDIQQAYINSKIDLAALEDLDVGENKVGLSGSGTWVTELTQVFKKKKCTFIDGDQRQQARTLIEKFIEKDLIG